MFHNQQIYLTSKSIYDKHQELSKQLETTTESKQIISLNKEIAKHRDVVDEYLKYSTYIQNIEDCLEIIKSEKNPDFIKLAQEELATNKKEVLKSEQVIQILLIPKDPNDDKDVIIEMHPAAGGAESAIFVFNLFDAYKKYADLNSWTLKIIDLQENDFGIASLVFSLSGKKAYSKMKFESGVHRVQRIPSTESKGRVHTSTITVSCLPEQDDVEVNIDPSDLRIDVYRASGAGGQHVNKTESAVRIIHIPTGILVACQQERSQISNRELAMSILRAKLWEAKTKEQNAEISSIVREQVGRGMRAEKIRTYNYPQNRITDHRISLTINNLEGVLMGNFQDLHDGLMNDEIAQSLKKMSKI